MIPTLWKRTAALACTALLACSTLTAYDDCTPCISSGDPCCYGGWDIGIDFIFWKPCIDNLEYAAVYEVDDSGDFDVNNLTYRNVCQKWEPGFRINLLKHGFICDWDLTGSFTYFRVHDKDSVSAPADGAPNLASPLLHAALAGDGLFRYIQGEYSAMMYRWDILFAYNLHCSNPCLELTPFLGMAGLTLNQSLESRIANDQAVTAQVESAFTDFDNRLFALGIKFGTEVNFTVTKGFNLFARGAGEILTGKQFNSKTVFTVEEANLDPESYQFNETQCCLIIPGYHIQVGLDLVSSLCGPEMGIRLGYEFFRYLNIPTARRFMGDQLGTQAALSTSPSLTTFGAHGIFVGAELSF